MCSLDNWSTYIHKHRHRASTSSPAEKWWYFLSIYDVLEIVNFHIYFYYIYQVGITTQGIYISICLSPGLFFSVEWAWWEEKGEPDQVEQLRGVVDTPRPCSTNSVDCLIRVQHTCSRISLTEQDDTQRSVLVGNPCQAVIYMLCFCMKQIYDCDMNVVCCMRQSLPHSCTYILCSVLGDLCYRALSYIHTHTYTTCVCVYVCVFEDSKLSCHKHGVVLF